MEIIQKSTAFLTGKGVESPRLQSESILAHVLGLPRMQLYLNFQRDLSEPEISSCRELVRRRGTREPLQHLVGSVSFCGLELRVNGHALIPRPETEQLVEHATVFLGTLPSPSPTILDFGTGTGCIGIALASLCPRSRIWACDISSSALELARTNAAALGVQDRVEFLQGDGFAAVPARMSFDLIVSNPPYIPSAAIKELQPEVRDFDPRLALDGGRAGLGFYRLLASAAKDHLNAPGRLMMEFGDGQTASIKELFADEKWIVEPPLQDYSGRERFLVARLINSEGAHSN